MGPASALTQERQARILGPAIGALVLVAAGVIGVIGDSPRALKIASAGFVLLVFLVVRGLIREPIEAKPFQG